MNDWVIVNHIHVGALGFCICLLNPVLKRHCINLNYRLYFTLEEVIINVCLLILCWFINLGLCHMLWPSYHRRGIKNQSHFVVGCCLGELGVMGSNHLKLRRAQKLYLLSLNKCATLQAAGLSVLPSVLPSLAQSYQSSADVQPKKCPQHVESQTNKGITTIQGHSDSSLHIGSSVHGLKAQHQSLLERLTLCNQLKRCGYASSQLSLCVAQGAWKSA